MSFLEPPVSNIRTPSVFEVVAQNNLMETLKPAFDQIMKVLSSSSPAYFNSAFKFRDELYLLINSGLQLHYLRLFNASFAENFYGLERRSASETGEILSPSFLSLVLVPYLRGKAARLFEKLREDEADGLCWDSKIANKITKVFLRVYPFLHCTWELTNLGILILYAMRKSKYQSLLGLLAGYYLTHVTHESRLATSAAKERLESTGGVQKILYGLVTTTASGIRLGLEVGSFFLQVVDHWYNNTTADVKYENRLVDPPPLIHGLAPGLCPLCSKKRRGDTVLPSSGVIFCYSCIVQYIRKKNKCPVTKVPAAEDQLVRLFYNSG